VKKILVGVDGFTRGHIERLRRAVAGWGEIATIEEKATLEEYEPKLKEADIAVGWPDPELLRKHPVEFLQIGSAGPDKYLGKGLGSLHMRACSARGNYSLGIAAQAAAMYLYFKRKLHVHVKDKERHVFMRHEPYDEVEGSTVCVVGLGEAGSRVARKLHALG